MEILAQPLPANHNVDVAPPGLVYISTSNTHNNHAASSDTLPSNTFEIDPKQARLKKLKCSVITGARLHEEELKSESERPIHQAIFLTLTYGPDKPWEAKHITQFLNSARSWVERQGFKFRYVWVAEIQEKRKMKFGDGAGHCVHYHVMIWLPRHLTFPKPDKRGWWTHGMTKTEKARNPVGYLAKYASKGTNYAFPKGARLHGTGGLNLSSRIQKAWWALPHSIRSMYPDQTEIIRRASGGGWTRRLTGEWFPALYEIVKFFPLIIRLKPETAFYQQVRGVV